MTNVSLQTDEDERFQHDGVAVVGIPGGGFSLVRVSFCNRPGANAELGPTTVVSMNIGLV